MICVTDTRPFFWLRVRCISPFCGHSRVVPLAPWRIRYGVENPSQMMRLHFRCGSCGRKGCEFETPRRGTGQNGANIGDDEQYPHGKELQRGYGEAVWPETRAEADNRVLKAYRARYAGGDAIKTVGHICNLYSMTKGPQAIRDLLKILQKYDFTGNLEPLPAIFPNRMAPIVRVGSDGQMQLEMARWGFPPPNVPGSKSRNPYLTNVRNTNSKYWLKYLKDPAYRCLVPWTSFSEPDNRGLEQNVANPRSIWTWFAQDETRPLAFFPGIWREFEGDRGTKKEPNVGKHLVYSFLTTDASSDVAPIHPDATPVCLFDEAAREMWMNAPWEIARDLQKPPTAGTLKIVARDTKQDG